MTSTLHLMTFEAFSLGHSLAMIRSLPTMHWWQRRVSICSSSSNSSISSSSSSSCSSNWRFDWLICDWHSADYRLTFAHNIYSIWVFQVSYVPTERWVLIPDVIICANFGVGKLRVRDIRGERVEVWALALKWLVSLRTVLRCCTLLSLLKEDAIPFITIPEMHNNNMSTVSGFC